MTPTADSESPRRTGIIANGARVAYWLCARHLPWSPRPMGRQSRWLRAALGRHMLDECGLGVNIEHSAWFGSGRGVRLGDRSDIGMDAW